MTQRSAMDGDGDGDVANPAQRQTQTQPQPQPPLVAWIRGVGLRGPGLPGFADSVATLAGREPHRDAPTAILAPAQLPPAERRRVGKGVKIALEVGFAAVADAGLDAADLPSVFTSSSGDGDNCDAICRALADDRLISPTRFHNSVHNAPSGYWGIASGAMAPSTSLCAYDDSFVAGLDDAMTQIAAGADAVLLVAYDAPYPEPLHAARPTPDAFGVAFVIAREADERARARIEWLPAAAEAQSAAGLPSATGSAPDDPSLERCRVAIPAARALPLLAALAGEAGRTTDLAFVDARGVAMRLRVDTTGARRPIDRTESPACT